MRKKIACTALLLIATYLLLPSPHYKMYRNISDSLPTKFFLGFPIKEIKRGQYVLFTHKESKQPLAKQIVGLPGDLIVIENHDFYINHKRIGTLLTRLSQGVLLLPIESGVIPQDHFFVMGSHKESFDSRYQKFGLVHRTQIEERLWPLL